MHPHDSPYHSGNPTTPSNPDCSTSYVNILLTPLHPPSSRPTHPAMRRRNSYPYSSPKHMDSIPSTILPAPFVIQPVLADQRPPQSLDILGELTCPKPWLEVSHPNPSWHLRSRIEAGLKIPVIVGSSSPPSIIEPSLPSLHNTSSHQQTEDLATESDDKSEHADADTIGAKSESLSTHPPTSPSSVKLSTPNSVQSYEPQERNRQIRDIPRERRCGSNDDDSEWEGFSLPSSTSPSLVQPSPSSSEGSGSHVRSESHATESNAEPGYAGVNDDDTERGSQSAPDEGEPNGDVQTGRLSPSSSERPPSIDSDDSDTEPDVLENWKWKDPALAELELSFRQTQEKRGSCAKLMESGISNQREKAHTKLVAEIENATKAIRMSRDGEITPLPVEEGQQPEETPNIECSYNDTVANLEMIAKILEDEREKELGRNTRDESS